MEPNKPKKFDSSSLFAAYKKPVEDIPLTSNASSDISNNSFSTAFQNKVFFYFVLISATIFALLKLPMAQVYYQIVTMILTFAPMIVILVMAILDSIKARKLPEYSNVIRKFYLPLP